MCDSIACLREGLRGGRVWSARIIVVVIVIDSDCRFRCCNDLWSTRIDPDHNPNPERLSSIADDDAPVVAATDLLMSSLCLLIEINQQFDGWFIIVVDPYRQFRCYSFAAAAAAISLSSIADLLLLLVLVLVLLMLMLSIRNYEDRQQIELSMLIDDQLVRRHCWSAICGQSRQREKNRSSAPLKNHCITSLSIVKLLWDWSASW